MFKVLERVQRHYPKAFIAGGALRDIHYNKPVKDVDIFIPTYKGVWAETLIDVLKEEFKDCDVMVKAHSIYMDSNLADSRFLPLVLEVIVKGQSYDIIFIEASGLPEVVEYFDLSICQIAHNGTTMYQSQAFKDTEKTGIITIQNINREDRQASRIARILKKYPEFKVEGNK